MRQKALLTRLRSMWRRAASHTPGKITRSIVPRSLSARLLGVIFHHDDGNQAGLHACLRRTTPSSTALFPIWATISFHVAAIGIMER